MKKSIQISILLFIACFFGLQPVQAATKAVNGSSVKLVYFFEANGSPILTAENKGDMELVLGNNLYPPEFEKQLIGMKKGDKKNITLAPEQAFGAYRPELIKRVAKNQLPPNLKLQEGMLIGGKDGQRPMRVAKILDDSVVLDQNNPLAGKTLTYHVEIIDVQ